MSLKTQISNDLFLEIFNFIPKNDIKTLLSITQVNHESRNYLSSDEIWKPIFLERFSNSKQVTKFFRLVFLQASFQTIKRNKELEIVNQKEHNSKNIHVKIAIFGANGSGRKSLLSRFVNNEFHKDYVLETIF